MRNLVVSAVSDRQIVGLAGEVDHCAWDYDTGGVYTCSLSGVITFVPPDARQASWTLSLADAAPLDDAEGGTQITSFAHVPESDALCVSDASGRLLMLDCGSRGFEEVGYLDGGVAALRWAPDGEALCVVTSRGQMLLMTKEWDVLGEVSLLGDGTAAAAAGDAAALRPEQVAITWRGDCKFVATLVQQQRPSAGEPAAAALDGSAGQADGQATLKIWGRENCALHAVGETVAGLLPVAAWQPNGRHLYVAHATATGPAVLLFETNGLQHGRFSVGATGSVAALEWSVDSQMLAVVVTGRGDDGGAAAASSRGGSSGSGGIGPQEHWVQVWQRSNWHWYLKREARHGAAQGRVLVAWDELAPPRLHTASAAGRLGHSAFLLQHSVSERGTAGVADGSTLLLTPLQHELVPPPMCSVAANCSTPVQGVSFYTRDDGVEMLGALLSDGFVAVFEAPEEDYWGEEPVAGSGSGVGGEDEALDAQAVARPTRRIRLDTGGATPRQLVWLDADHALLVARSAPTAETSGAAVLDSGDVLLAVDLATGNAVSEAALPAGQQVLQALPASGAAAPLVQLQDGSLFTWADSQLRPAPGSGFPEPCPAMAHTPAEAAGPGVPLAVGLSASGKLYWGPLAVDTASAVTSLAVRTNGPGGAFLAFTERTGSLHTLPFAQLAAHAPAIANADGGQRRPRGVKPDSMQAAMHAAMRPASADAGATAITERAYEQGGLLVAAPPEAAQLVLQMPRGNLEAIAPRVLVLAAVAAALQAGDYAAAWEAAIVNRVDLNCLVDFGWPAFPSAAPAFLAAVPSDADVADLIAALRPGSVVAPGGMYAGMATAAPELRGAAAAAAAGESKEDASLEDKVPRVCEALREAMVAAGPRRYFRAILSSLSKVDRLPDALRLIKDAKEAELAAEAGGQQPDELVPAGGSGDGGMAPSAEDGLKHLMLFSDVETLYRAALGEYELGLAYMVIAGSQRDPGEYMLQLQCFAGAGALPLQRAAIDTHLGRYGTALGHLMAAEPPRFDDALALAQDKASGLLRELLLLCCDDAERRSTVLAALGQSLAARSLHEDAGVAFVAAGRLPEALAAYRASGAYAMALTLAGRLGWPEAEVRQLAADMAEEAAGLGALRESAALLADYRGAAAAEAVVLRLTQAEAWREALRVAYRFARPDLVDSIVQPAALEAAAALTETTDANTARVAKYLARYREVQAKRLAMQAAVDEREAAGSGDGGGNGACDGDSGSQAESTTVSDLSAYTTGTTAAGGSSSASVSGVPESTIGGRKPAKRSALRKAKKGMRIRQGSPQEEASLAEHVAGLAPAPRVLADAGSLAEALVLFGAEEAAAGLQRGLSKLQADQRAAAEYIQSHPPPTEGPGAALAPPPLPSAAGEDVRWKWEMLRSVAIE